MIIGIGTNAKQIKTGDHVVVATAGELVNKGIKILDKIQELDGESINHLVHKTRGASTHPLCTAIPKGSSEYVSVQVPFPFQKQVHPSKIHRLA